MDLIEPHHEPTHPDYMLECEEALDQPLSDLIDQAIGAGWEPRKVFKAIKEVADLQAQAYEEDPDPAGE